MDFLLRLKAAKYQLRPSFITPWALVASPFPGVSILIISAPMSPRSMVQKGPESIRVRSTTLIPVRGIGNLPVKPEMSYLVFLELNLNALN